MMGSAIVLNKVSVFITPFEPSLYIYYLNIFGVAGFWLDLQAGYGEEIESVAVSPLLRLLPHEGLLSAAAFSHLQSERRSARL